MRTRVRTLGRTIRGAAAAVALTTAVGVASGCSGSAPPPSADSSGAPTGLASLTAAQILDRTKAAAESAKTVHVVGSFGVGDQALTMDLRIDGSTGAVGTIKLPQGTMHVVRLGADFYVKGDTAFWTSAGLGSDAAKLVKGYLKAKASDATFKDFATLTDVKQFFDGLMTSTGTLTKGAVTTYNGARVISLVDPATDGGTLLIALDGKPYPLALTPPSGATSSGSITFTEYDQPVTVTAPPANQVITKP